jgi:hypothetical protein
MTSLPPSPPSYSFLDSRDAFERFVQAWEAGRLPKASWTHAAHVAVGACYAVRYGAGALDRIRAGIIRYNTAVGTANTETSGYHETLTRFWTAILATSSAGVTDEWEAACAAVHRFGEARNLHTQYYSFDVVCSPEARRQWLAPDLKPLMIED